MLTMHPKQNHWLLVSGKSHNMTFGKWLSMHREQQNLTWKLLAVKAGYGMKMVQAVGLDYKQPNLQMAIDLSAAVGKNLIDALHEMGHHATTESDEQS